jgi:hypothetical protein
MTFGAGSFYGYKLVNEANADDAITLTRLWLSDELPKNSESRVLGMALRELKINTTIKFVLAYSDPVFGHVGIIYQATNWLYTGLSYATGLYDIGDGALHHSRSLAHQLGSHSIDYLVLQGINARIVPQQAKHRYIYFLDESYRHRLVVPVMPYPKKEGVNIGSH